MPKQKKKIKNNKPLFSKNIIFFDTEFTNLDHKVGELLSIGLIKYTGEKLYIELEYENKNVHPWVKKRVLPYLTKRKITREKAQEKINKFIGINTKGKDKPCLMAYVNQFDAIYWYDLFGTPKKHPAFWIPIDFASILFAHGFAPDSFGKKAFLNKIGIDKTKYIEHNALEDAKMLRDVYLKLYD